MKRVGVFGSTGSIGRSTLEVIRHLKPDFSIFALAAKNNLKLLAEQSIRTKPEFVIVNDESAKMQLKKFIAKTSIKILVGEPGLKQIAQHQKLDVLVMAMSGTMGIRPILKAIQRRKQIALSTKELLVSFGEIIMAQAKECKADILPVDSELAGLHQCLNNRNPDEIKRVIITASGGPFYNRKNLDKITVSQALQHPIWKMGRKITIDSATLANKGLEVIETSRLFSLPPEKIKVLIHPQSVVHAMVEFKDNSVIAQLAEPDMRACIQYALTYPKREASLIKQLDLSTCKKLEFSEPDLKKFSALQLAYQALKQGNIAPCVYNTANEVAVSKFLSGAIEFNKIPDMIKKCLNKMGRIKKPSLNQLLECETKVRMYAERLK